MLNITLDIEVTIIILEPHAPVISSTVNPL